VPRDELLAHLDGTPQSGDRFLPAAQPVESIGERRQRGVGAEFFRPSVADRQRRAAMSDRLPRVRLAQARMLADKKPLKVSQSGEKVDVTLPGGPTSEYASVLVLETR